MNCETVFLQPIAPNSVRSCVRACVRVCVCVYRLLGGGGGLEMGAGDGGCDAFYLLPSSV